jgi:hypothetical protein
MATISGGDKLERALLEMARQVSKPATLRLGFLGNATYPDGKSVALIAALNELGTSRMPPRPYFRNMIAAKSPGWPAAIAVNLKANNYDAERSLDDVGQAIAGQLQQSIRDLTSPPLSPVTIARKGFSKPLIDTGQMLNSVGYEVNSR